jgi:hypothetical protein
VVRKRSKGALAVAMVAACLIVGIGTFFGIRWVLNSSVEQREPGTWPDMGYLATLVDEPDRFIRAVNIPELESEYRAYRSSGIGEAEHIMVDIDIIDIVNPSGGIPNERSARFDVWFASDGSIHTFALTGGTPASPAIIADESTIGLDALALAFVFGPNPRETLDEVYAELLSHGEVFEEQYRKPDPMISEFMLNPSQLLAHVGISESDLVNTSSDYGFAEWEKGYVESIYSLYAQYGTEPSELVMPTTGAVFVQNGEMNQPNSRLLSLNIVDFTRFSWEPDEEHPWGLVVYSYSWFSVISSADTSQRGNARTFIDTESNAENNTIWVFGES